MSLVEIHMVVNYPASNLNRDDTGAPKTMMFNGVPRVRLSSQCLKRAWRLSGPFMSAFKANTLRTRYMPQMVANELRSRGCDAEIVAAIGSLLGTDSSADEIAHGEYRSTNIGFYSSGEIKQIADAAERVYNDPENKKCFENGGDRKKFAQALANERKKCAVENPVGLTVDQALFGRMVTDGTADEIDAAMQVAHAMSVNAAHIEDDYFTAIDDFLDGKFMPDHAVTAHLNSAEFDSSCFYIHVVIDMDQLAVNLKNNPHADEYMKHAISTLIRTMAFTAPSGKQNTFEAHTLPIAIYVEQKNDHIPVNLCNAFARPINSNVAAASTRALADEITRVASVYGIPTTHRVWLNTHPAKTDDEYGAAFAGPALEDVVRVTSMNDLCAEVDSWE